MRCRPHLSPLRQQFRDTDEVVADQIEQKVGGDCGHSPVFRLAHGAVCKLTLLRTHPLACVTLVFGLVLLGPPAVEQMVSDTQVPGHLRGGPGNSDSVISGSLASLRPPRGGHTKERGNETNETESRSHL